MPTYEPEDIVNDLRQRVAALGSRRITALIVGALLLIFLSSTWFTVQPEETGIVQLFGAVDRTVGPGLHFKFPDGIEKVRMVPTARVLKEEFGFGTAATGAGGRTQYVADKKGFKDVSLMLTGDLNVIDVQWIVQYRSEDPVRYLFRVRESPQTIRDIAESVMRRVVGNRLGSDVLTVGRGRPRVAGHPRERRASAIPARPGGVPAGAGGHAPPPLPRGDGEHPARSECPVHRG